MEIPITILRMMSKLVQALRELPNGREELLKLRHQTQMIELYNKALSGKEARYKVHVPLCYFVQTKWCLKTRKYRPLEMPVTDEWNMYTQIVVPSKYRSQILELAHNLVHPWVYILL